MTSPGRIGRYAWSLEREATYLHQTWRSVAGEPPNKACLAAPAAQRHVVGQQTDARGAIHGRPRR